MKKVPAFTFLLWLLLVAAYKFFPQLLFNQYVQYPLATLLSILLPVSFWLMVQEGKKFRSLLFIGIFFLNSALLLYALERNYAAQKMLGNASGKGIAPEIAEMLTRAEPLQKRQFAARFIYQKYGVALPYKSSDITYSLYSVNQSDTEQYRKNAAQASQVDMVMMDATQKMLTAFLLLALHVGIFTILLVCLILYELEPQKGTRRRIKFDIR